MYTSRLYRLLVYLYVPLIVVFPFFIDYNILLTLTICILVIYILYDFPDIFGTLTKSNTILATRNNSLVQLFLEEEYSIDLSQVEKIQVSTGIFPISPVKLEILQSDGTTLTLKTHIYSSKLIRFLQSLRPVQAS